MKNMWKFVPVLLLGLLFVALLGCTPPHYSVDVARGQNHVTFAQRHHDQSKNDYLVDCKVDASGAYKDCYTIELKGE
jgi:hypothetical protein